MNKNIFKFLLVMFIFNFFSPNFVYGETFSSEKNIIIYSLNNFFTDYYSCLTKLEIKDLSSYFNNITYEERNSYSLTYEALRLEINILNANNDLSNTNNKSTYLYSNDFKDISVNNNYATVSFNQEIKITDLSGQKTNTVYKEFLVKLVKNNNQYTISTMDSNSYYVDLLKNITPKDGNYKESADLYFNETKNLMAKNNSSKKTDDSNPFSLKSILNYVSKMFTK